LQTRASQNDVHTKAQNTFKELVREKETIEAGILHKLYNVFNLRIMFFVKNNHPSKT